jgi:hypothetical protein
MKFIEDRSEAILLDRNFYLMMEESLVNVHVFQSVAEVEVVVQLSLEFF